MLKSTQSKILAALAALIAAIAAVVVQIQAIPTTPDPTPTAGAVSPAPAGHVAPSPAGSSTPPTAGQVAPIPPATDPAFAKFRVGLQTWFVDASWTGESMFSAPGVLSQTYVSQFDAESDVVRAMDSGAINCSKEKAWSDRRLPGESNQTAYGDMTSNSGPGVAIEHRIALCNATKSAVCWFVVPHAATDDYVTQFALLVKAQLKGSVPAVELSNEIWNDSFCQAAYAKQQGAALGLPGSNAWYQASSWDVYRSLQIGRLFKATLPNAKLIVSFSGDYGRMRQALIDVYRSSKWNPSSVVIDMLAVAPYVGSSPYSLASFKTSVDHKLAQPAGDNLDTIPAARQIANDNGIAVLGCYETGGNYFGAGSISYWNDASTGQAYTYMLDAWSRVFNGPCNLYAHASQVKNDTAWGLWGVPANAPTPVTKSARATAVEQWIATH